MNKKRKSNKIFLRWVLSLLGLALMVAIAVFVILNRNELGSSLDNIFKKSDEEDADVIQIETDSTASFAAVGNSLAVAFDSGVRVYNKSGENVYSGANVFSSPAIVSMGDWAAAYDIGGKELQVISSKGKTANISTEQSIVSVSMSKGGMVLVTEEQGYKSSATVYNSDFSPVYKWYSGTGYITCAAVSPSCKRMAAISISSDGAHLSMFDLNSEQVKGTFTDESVLPVDVAFLSDSNVAVLTGSSLRIFDEQANMLTEYSFGGLQILDYSFAGDGFAVLALAPSRWSEDITLVKLGADGEVKEERSEKGSFSSLSVYGTNIAILFSDRLEICKESLKNDDEYEIKGAKKVLMRKDGCAALVYDYIIEIFGL